MAGWALPAKIAVPDSADRAIMVRRRSGEPTTPKTISEEEYQKIRRGVIRLRADKELVKRAEEALAEPGPRRFETVEEFMAYLNTLMAPQDRPAASGKKVR